LRVGADMSSAPSLDSTASNMSSCAPMSGPPPGSALELISGGPDEPRVFKRKRAAVMRKVESRVRTMFEELDLLLKAEQINRRIMVRPRLPDPSRDRIGI
jgi:hypothetical protein